jgi:hypothetical protein
VPLNLFPSANPRLINRCVTYHVDTGNNSPLRLTSAALSQVQQQQQQGRGVGTPVSESFYSGELSGVYCASTYFVSQCARFASNLRRQKQHVHCLPHFFTHIYTCVRSHSRAGTGSASPLPRDEKEMVVGGFLGVRVKTGTQMVKKRDDTKLHHSYEVSGRLCGSVTVCAWAK